MAGALIRREEVHSEDSNAMTEAETEETQLQAKGPQGLQAPPEASKEARKDPPPQVSGRAWPCRHLGFELLASGTK